LIFKGSSSETSGKKQVIGQHIAREWKIGKIYGLDDMVKILKLQGGKIRF
jgi:hypothetical protein